MISKDNLSADFLSEIMTCVIYLPILLTLTTIINDRYTGISWGVPEFLTVGGKCS